MYLYTRCCACNTCMYSYLAHTVCPLSNKCLSLKTCTDSLTCTGTCLRIGGQNGLECLDYLKNFEPCHYKIPFTFFLFSVPQ